MKSISIIIPTYTAVKYLEVCLESIYQNQANKNNEVVVVVDGTYELNKHVIYSYDSKLNLKTIVFDENRGLAEATNHGFFQATNELCLVINDDNVCPKDFDKILVEEWERQQIFQKLRHLLIVPNQIEPTPSIFKPFKIHDFGDLGVFNLTNFTETELELREDKQVWNEGWTFPLFLSKETYLSVGGLDTTYQSPHVIDWELFIKLEKIGCYNKRLYSLNFYHFGSKTARTPESYRKEHEAHDYFKYKWAFNAYNRLL
jgi:glycosyltransferase involved in cell wall biosynthesis